MAASELAILLSAIVGGGALYKMIEAIVLTIINKGKTTREELREEIARLEAKIREQEIKIEHLQDEIDEQLSEKNEQLTRNIELLSEVSRLGLMIDERNHRIMLLEEQIETLRNAIKCQYADACPLLSGAIRKDAE